MSTSSMSYDYQRTRTSSLQGDQKKALKLAAKLKQHIVDLEKTLRGSDEGEWDPVQGLSEDLVDDSNKLLQMTKQINKARDSQSNIFMR